MTKQSKTDDRDWSKLSLGDCIRQIELEGYVLIPDLLNTKEISALKQETARLETKAADYSVHQQGARNIETKGGKLVDLIAHPVVTSFLKELFGDVGICMSYAFVRSAPGHPGVSLHTDGQPYGSEIFGYEGSCPWTVRVLFYLDDLTPEVSPFRVIPRSHLCMHSDANPYKRYEEHPEEVIIPAKAGSAILINHKVFHGTHPNVGDRARELLAIGYRPAWAGPIKDVSQWSPELIASLPEVVRPFFGDRNHREWAFEGGNKPANMAREAPGMNPSRWDRE